MHGNAIYQTSLPGLYDPNRLLDLVAHRLEVRNDAALAQRLRVARSGVQGIRQRVIPMTPSLLLWLHEASGIAIDELRRVMGHQRPGYGQVRRFPS